MNNNLPAKLSWLRSDPECRLGLKGARFTRTSSLFTGMIALLLTILFYMGIRFLPSNLSPVVDIFCNRGPIQYFSVFATSWGVAILIVKGLKLKLQQKCLDHVIVPQESDFVLSTTTVEDVFENIYKIVDDPKHFVLFNRIAVALSNLRNLGRVTDVDEILRSQAEHDESIMESSYSLIRGLIWAVPVLGFIGTVLGLSDAISGFGGVMAATEDMGEITTALKGVTSGLATAFDTTLVALVAALCLQLATTFLHKNEEEFLDSCTEYCQRNIVNRLRIMPFHSDET
ncbi:MotA/TolQ/ExbB proton channel family protein [Bythopirellula goksoeyrii]|uniref:MotA/TolQ/ExbB proton channel family protein n=1 Tax=Bythopirellula goksoeyrii TaxID=1400387 RepID=A0A5B9QLV1_9BACT|nr:MotA/TolQ/ExbB proton channel family protein [Bythopirellula goksoeyrii]